MIELSAQAISGKDILLRYDIDVPVVGGKVTDDFRLEAGLETLDFCLEHGNLVVLMGHLGRPEGKMDPQYSVKPIVDWFEARFAHIRLKSGRLHVLENLRFEPGEEGASMDFARELASYGNFFVNESFAAYRPAASTTILPTILPHAAGFTFASEVKVLCSVRDNPDKPLVVIMGGAKIEDKLPVITAMAKIADMVLVGGKLPKEIAERAISLPENVSVGKLNGNGTDITSETVEAWENQIKQAATIVWNGPLGKFEEQGNDMTKIVGRMVLESGAKLIVGGGDIINALSKYRLLAAFAQKGHVSTGGGASLKLLAEGILPTIEVLG